MGSTMWLKRVRALQRKKGRQEEGLFLVQGRKVVQELLASGWPTEVVLATAEVIAELGLRHAEVVAQHDMDRMGTFEQGNELIAVVRTPAPVAPRKPGPGALVLALDGITDPGNLGTLLRIADWFGVEQVWCSPDCVELYNPKCVQASMGSLFRVPVAYAPLDQALFDAVGSGAAVYKAEASGTDVFATGLVRPAVLVLGSESHGLSDAVHNGPGSSIAVPRAGMAESLNVATAASALCMEFMRQKRG